MSSAKKQKGSGEEPMDVGMFLMDSTMTYVPKLSETSTDTDIDGLEKHDAILELAEFIRKCGKRANFHQLNLSSLVDLHRNLKIARDEHKKVKSVFPEMSGVDARWFGPRSDRVDHDYEPSDTSDIDLDDT